MVDFPAIGVWNRDQVRVSWTESTRRIVPEVEQIIEQTWQREILRPGIHLFDGPMCRVESIEIKGNQLHLALSKTAYKPFLGTNLHNPHLADRFGPEVMANPLGLSAALISSDGFLLLGRRSERVAYYPSRVHPFAGCLEPQEKLDVFAGIQRELNEELSLTESDLEELVCVGVARDLALRQPELVFAAKCKLDRAQIESQLDQQEHRAVFSAPATHNGIEEALQSGEIFTPVAVGAMLLWGRQQFGGDWFDSQKALTSV